MTAIKEVALTFKERMIALMLEGKKDVTRRPIKIPYGYELKDRRLYKITKGHPKKGRWGAMIVRGKDTSFPEHDLVPAPCFDGDLAWVRETWRRFNSSNECGCSEYPCGCPNNNTPLYKVSHDDGESRWHSPSVMPRNASRMTLYIANVTIERLQDITKEQAQREGFKDVDDFAMYWSSLYAQKGYGWNNNPYVWVIEYKVVQENIEKAIPMLVDLNLIEGAASDA